MILKCVSFFSQISFEFRLSNFYHFYQLTFKNLGEIVKLKSLQSFDVELEEEIMKHAAIVVESSRNVCQCAVE